MSDSDNKKVLGKLLYKDLNVDIDSDEFFKIVKSIRNKSYRKLLVASYNIYLRYKNPDDFKNNSNPLSVKFIQEFTNCYKRESYDVFHTLNLLKHIEEKTTSIIETAIFKLKTKDLESDIKC